MRLTKEVDIVPTVQDVEVGVEQADTERIPAEEGDTGEVLTLPDGSVSVPVFEEELVITKRLVVRERIIVRKHTVSTTQRVQADLRRERWRSTSTRPSRPASPKPGSRHRAHPHLPEDAHVEIRHGPQAWPGLL